MAEQVGDGVSLMLGFVFVNPLKNWFVMYKHRKMEDKNHAPFWPWLSCHAFFLLVHSSNLLRSVGSIDGDQQLEPATWLGGWSILRREKVGSIKMGPVTSYRNRTKWLSIIPNTTGQYFVPLCTPKKQGFFSAQVVNRICYKAGPRNQL